MDSLLRYQQMADRLVLHMKRQARARGTQQDAAERMGVRRIEMYDYQPYVSRLVVSRLLTGRSEMSLPIFLELADDIFGEGTAERICEAVSGRRGESHAD